MLLRPPPDDRPRLSSPHTRHQLDLQPLAQLGYNIVPLDRIGTLESGESVFRCEGRPRVKSTDRTQDIGTNEVPAVDYVTLVRMQPAPRYTGLYPIET